MKLSPVAQAIVAIPDAGGLVVAESREARSELIEALYQYGPPAALERVVIVVVSADEMTALLRLPGGPGSPTFYRPSVRARGL